MPGDNCAVFGCGSCRRTKGIGICHRLSSHVRNEVGEGACPQCLEYQVSSRKTIKAKERRLSKPANVKALLSKTDPERIKLTLQEQRLKCPDLERNEMRVAIAKTNIEVDHELSNDFTKTLDEADDKITSFMSLFWQQQKKLFSNAVVLGCGTIR